MIKTEEKYIVCDICDRNITHEYVYPKKVGLRWLYSQRKLSGLMNGNLSFRYDITQIDLCGSCWKDLVILIGEKRLQTKKDEK